jgi:hydroxylamine oxidation protein HaoB
LAQAREGRAALTATQAVLARSSRTRLLLPSLGILLVTGGLLLLGWLAYLWLNPGPAPYHYELVEEGGVAKFDKLGLEAWPDLAIRKYEVRVDGLDKPLAVGHLAHRGEASPVLLDWENRTGEPVAALDSKLPELSALVAAINKHAPKDALVLAWWDTSRQLRLLGGRDTLFASHLGEPSIVPSQWRGRGGAIEKLEREFWGAPAPAEERRAFQRFAGALAANASEGAAMLRELAGSREAYVAVHVTDLYKLGLMRPDRLDMAYKDFPMGANLHGLIGYLKGWMRDHNYATYALQSLSDHEVRGYFLRDAASGNTLLAQMLPFTTSKPLELQAVQLVYQHGGYWVYKIPPASPSG